MKSTVRDPFESPQHFDFKQVSSRAPLGQDRHETVMGTKRAIPQDLPKIATGIQGFDELSHGGLPRRRISLLKGGPGSGKTVFALQSLVNAAREREESGIFVAFEESPRQIIANAGGFDWALPPLVKNKMFS